MIEVSVIKKMPLENLIKYKEALEILCSLYEDRMMPLYGKATMFDRPTSDQVSFAQKMQKAKGYLNVIFQAIEEKTFNELDSWTGEEKKEEIKTVKKKVTNAKKATKKN